MPKTGKGRAITFDMLRAFDSLATTLNLSDTAKQLGATRQTVRRHISDLERFRGGPLFCLTKHTYQLTPLGEASLAGARSLLRQADRWSRGDVMSSSGYQHLEVAQFVADDGTKFVCQQHPVSRVAEHGTTLVQRTVQAWGTALAQIEAPAMGAIRDHLAIYRRSTDGWICVEIGDQSTYAKWFGWTWAKSAVGRLSEDDRAGSEYNRFISEAYDRIHGEGGVRFDHLFAHLPRETSDHAVPVTFQRLLMGCVFPDGAPALAVMPSVTRNVAIDALNPEDIAGVSAELLKEFEAPTIQ